MSVKWRITIVVVLSLLVACVFNSKPAPVPVPGMITLEAQTLPATVKIGIDPPTDNPAGWNVSQDGGASTFVPVTTGVACNDFFTNAASTCVPFSFTFTTAGVHTVTIASVSAGGAASPSSLSFNLSVPAPAAHLHAVK